MGVLIHGQHQRYSRDRVVSTCLSVSSPLLYSISAVRTRVQSNFCFVSYVKFCVSVFLILFFICIVQSLNKLVTIQGAHLDFWKISNSVARLETAMFCYFKWTFKSTKKSAYSVFVQETMIIILKWFCYRAVITLYPLVSH